MTRFVRLRVRLIYPEVVAIQAAILLAAVSRGLDYLLPPRGPLNTLSVIEKAMPIELWGALFLVGGLFGLVGLYVNRWPIAAVGHVILLATYAAFAVGAFLDVLGRDSLEGWRTPLDWALVFAVIHWGFADACVDAWREKNERRRR